MLLALRGLDSQTSLKSFLPNEKLLKAHSNFKKPLILFRVLNFILNDLWNISTEPFHAWVSKCTINKSILIFKIASTDPMIFKKSKINYQYTHMRNHLKGTKCEKGYRNVKNVKQKKYFWKQQEIYDPHILKKYNNFFYFYFWLRLKKKTLQDKQNSDSMLSIFHIQYCLSLWSITWHFINNKDERIELRWKILFVNKQDVPLCILVLVISFAVLLYPSILLFYSSLFTFSIFQNCSFDFDFILFFFRYKKTSFLILFSFFLFFMLTRFDALLYECPHNRLESFCHHLRLFEVFGFEKEELLLSIK